MSMLIATVDPYTLLAVGFVAGLVSCAVLIGSARRLKGV